MSEKDDESPEIYALKREGGGGWSLSRRDFLKTAVAAGGAAAFLGVGHRAYAEELKRTCADGAFAHGNYVSSLSFSPDGTALASSSIDGSVKLWSIPDGAHISTLVGNAGLLQDIAFSPDGKSLAACGGSGTIRILSVPNGAIISSMQLNNGDLIRGIAISPDGKSLASASSEGVVDLWSYPEGAHISSHQLRDCSRLGNTHISISPNGKLLAVADTSIGEIHLLSLPSGKAARATLSGHRGGTRTARISPDGKRLVSGGEDYAIKIWSLSSGELETEISETMKLPYSMAFSPDGKHLVAANEDKTIKIWSFPSCALRKSFISDDSFAASVAVSPDGKLLASGGGDKTIKLWSFPEGEFLGCLMDLASSYSDAKGRTFQTKGASGPDAIHTLPCGSALPADAVCVCDCVAGSAARPGPKPAEPSGSGGSSTYSSHYWHPN